MDFDPLAIGVSMIFWAGMFARVLIDDEVSPIHPNDLSSKRTSIILLNGLNSRAREELDEWLKSNLGSMFYFYTNDHQLMVTVEGRTMLDIRSKVEELRNKRKFHFWRKFFFIITVVGLGLTMFLLTSCGQYHTYRVHGIIVDPVAQDTTIVDELIIGASADAVRAKHTPEYLRKNQVRFLRIDEYNPQTQKMGRRVFTYYGPRE